MSPENVTGYLCARTSPSGPCVTVTPHPCSDHGVRTNPPQTRRTSPNPAFKSPCLPKEEDHLSEEMDDETDTEQDIPKETGYDGKFHRCNCERPRVWSIHTKRGDLSGQHRPVLYLCVDCYGKTGYYGYIERGSRIEDRRQDTNVSRDICPWAKGEHQIQH